MKTVFIAIPWFTPAYKAGGPIRSVFNLVNKFSNDIQFRIFCSNKDIDGLTLKDIQTDKWIDFNDHTKVWYVSSVFPIFSFKKQLRDQQADVLYVVGMFSLSYNIIPIFFGKANKIIIAPKGMLHTPALSQKNFKKGIYLKFIKITGICKNVHFHATDLNEIDSIKSNFDKNSKISVASNYPTFYTPSLSRNKKIGVLKLITLALVSPMKNHLIVLQALKTCEGLIEYHIIGGIKDKAYWKKCEQFIQLLPKNIHVIYHGEVTPNNISCHFNDAPVMIMPSESENYGHSIIESLSAGIPVITSFSTPWNNLQENNAGFNTEVSAEKIKNLIDFYVSMDQNQYMLSSKAAIEYSSKSINENKINLDYQKLFIE